ncbi:unnamed protein product [Schistosoma margrebowiei]|uniref:Uncharacterized protein n=1 Tax=Schistosoma margrebowiei TaxID=48269 RepID=A0A183LAH6_9TREM|nr:unnamed protein product [Schistosoma margrebowiei]
MNINYLLGGWMAASSGIQDARFVLFRTRQLDIPASVLVFTPGLEPITVRFKRHRYDDDHHHDVDVDDDDDRDVDDHDHLYL